MNITIAFMELKVQKDVANPATEDDILVSIKGDKEILINAIKLLFLKHPEFKAMVNEAGRRANAERAKEGN